MASKISISKLQREAVRILNRINNNDNNIVTSSIDDTVFAKSELFPNALIKYIFSKTTNYIAIVVSEKNKLTGYDDTVKRIDFKYTKNSLA